MIYSLNGKVVHLEQNLAVIECGGVGYAVRTSAQTSASLKIDENARLFTYMHLSENNAEIFGFTDDFELTAFKLLLSVSGVGPKAALSVLSSLTAGDFALAVISEENERLVKCPGIGAKTASRIILELKEKLAKMTGEGSVSRLKSVGTKGNFAAEAISALVVLGFAASDAAKALDGVEAGTSTSEMIKLALRKLSKR
ncbi:MAG: Holliday junction branch migration protein RuvA [Oscillospiraceae bacterium]|jgi:Holliday junction DNA helicase RuvA|nr:Holliday junction branch migration protein RuvA [Oscillospiraceae bacterium]